jgi:chromate transporter
LFVLPGAIVILGLAIAYSQVGGVPLVDALFLGIKACVVVVVIEALLRVSRRALTQQIYWVIAAAAFAGIFVLGIPFPVIIVAAALFGAFIERGTTATGDGRLPANRALASTLTIGLALWAAPILVAWAAGSDLLLDVGLFFSKLAVVTFGGAYAVLAYMAQEVVQTYGWVRPAELMDALGLAETTPGPLILVTEFIGFLAGYGKGGTGLGIAAACLTLWVTFVPCFLWIFAFAPYVEWIASQPRLGGALKGITAAVVGVIANLALWFGLHVLFRVVHPDGPLALPAPDLASFDWRALVIGVAAGVMLLRLHYGLLKVLGISAVAGVVLSLAG